MVGMSNLHKDQIRLQRKINVLLLPWIAFMMGVAAMVVTGALRWLNGELEMPALWTIVVTSIFLVIGVCSAPAYMAASKKERRMQRQINAANRQRGRRIERRTNEHFT